MKTSGRDRVLEVDEQRMRMWVMRKVEKTAQEY